MEESLREEGISDEEPEDLSIATEDMISKLPDPLICQILSYLRTKEVVRTSVMSKRWKSVWLLISGLDLNSNEFPDYDTFVSFVDRVLDFSREHKLCLQKFKLSIHKDEVQSCLMGCIDINVATSKTRLSIHKNENEQFCLTRWVDLVATSKLKHLHIECPFVSRRLLEVMPLSLYVCEKLLYLRLNRVLLGKIESVSLPCLKVMILELNVYADEASLKLLISSCPVLEDLIMVRRARDNVKVLRVHSQSLTRLLIIVNQHHDAVESIVEEFDYANSGLLVDAPRLKLLELRDEVSESKTISNSGSLVKVNIYNRFRLKNRVDVDLRKRYMVLNFFTSISGVRDMRICYEAYKLIQDIMPLPQFCNLTSLKAELESLEGLPTFLEKFPNLKSLVLVFTFCSMKKIRHWSVPQCLLSSLEFLEIYSSYNKGPIEMEVARYFTENSAILKRLVMGLDGFMRGRNKLAEDSILLRDLLALPRRSRTCQFLVV